MDSCIYLPFPSARLLVVLTPTTCEPYVDERTTQYSTVLLTRDERLQPSSFFFFLFPFFCLFPTNPPFSSLLPSLRFYWWPYLTASSHIEFLQCECILDSKRYDWISTTQSPADTKARIRWQVSRLSELWVIALLDRTIHVGLLTY